MRSIWLRSSPVSTEAAVVPGAMGAWAAGALHPLGRSHRHHQVLDFLEGVVADRFTGLLLQSRLDLIIRDPAAVLGDQGDQGIGEVGEVGHQSGQWQGGGSGNPTQILL